MRKRRFIRKWGWMLLSFILLFCATVTAGATTLFGISDTQYVLVEEDTLLYSEDKDYVVSILEEGTFYEVEWTNDNWTKIKLTEKVSGYVLTENVDVVDSPGEIKRTSDYIDTVIEGREQADEINNEAFIEEIADAIDTMEENLEYVKGLTEETTAVSGNIESIEEYISLTETVYNSSVECVSAWDVEQEAIISETIEGYIEAVQTQTEEAVEIYEDVIEERQALVDYAVSFVGVLPYVWGGTSLVTGADCSGFTQSVYKSFGYSIPRTVELQKYAGTSVSLSDIKVGDLVIFSGHVGIYIGNGQFVHSPSTGQKVKISALSTFPKSVIAVRRIIT